MKKNRRHRLSAIVLLMVMVLQLGVRIAHQHHHELSAQVSCSDCEHNRVHSGHVSSWDGEQDDCLLCQILATPYLQAEDVCNECYIVEQPMLYADCISAVQKCGCLNLSLRGPPSFLL